MEKKQQQQQQKTIKNLSVMNSELDPVVAVFIDDYQFDGRMSHETLILGLSQGSVLGVPILSDAYKYSVLVTDRLFSSPSSHRRTPQRRCGVLTPVQLALQ